jgi:hypothetical protein
MYSIHRQQMAHAPGTIYRSDDVDGAHYTAVLTHNGTLLEIKNPESSHERISFADLDAWAVARGIDKSSLKVDTSKAYGVVITEDNHGFKYKSAKKWLKWCYEMMAEGAPHLLTNLAVKEAYNVFVDICEEYNLHLQEYFNIHTKYLRHNPLHLCDETHFKKLGGFPGYLQFGHGYYKPQQFIATAHERITNAYTALYALIKDDLTPFLEERHTQMKSEENKMKLRRKIKHLEKKKKQLEDMLTSCKTQLGS